MNKLQQKYSSRLDKFKTELNEIKRKNYWVSALRLIIFLSAIALSFIIGKSGINTILWVNFIALIPFLYLVRVNVRNQQKIALLKNLVKINEDELKALSGNFSVFPAGMEYLDYDHPFTYDLDIFGEASIYQSLNRTCTKGGADRLADFLKNPLLNIQSILNRQQAVNELSAKLDWRQNFQATGNIIMENEEETDDYSSWFSLKNKLNRDADFHKEIIDWINSGFYFSKIKILPFLLIVLPMFSVTALIFTILGLFPFMGLVLVVLFMLAVVGLFNKKIMEMHARIGKKVKILDKYERLLRSIENESFKSKDLKDLITDNHKGAQKPSSELKKLKKLAGMLDNRLNLVFIIFADGFLLWDLQIVLRLEKWREKNHENIEKWFQAIYQFDALNSLANLAHNHPAFVMPKPVEGAFYLKMQAGGHPLLDEKIRIDNDFSINGYSQIRIITGANMAGKSTFLRTMGVNLILAMAGSVVCAREFKFVPVALHTSVRTNDSLQKHESYFYAELKRLKSIIEQLETGKKLFVIVDEMLRGTNSKDKHLGSAALIERLIKLQASGLIATHDIELGKMIEKYPQNIENYRFEVDIKDNELFFDYKIKIGISQNLNAMFLMKKMGIVE